MKKIIFAFLALALAAASAIAVLSQPEAAPEVRFATLSGERLATSDLRGKVVLVNFWATSCVACLKEMPRMTETYKKFAPRGYEMIAVAMSYDHPNEVARYAASRGLPFKVALDGDGAVARGFGNIRATPTSFLIDRNGRILKHYVGEPEWSEFHALLEEALGNPV
jgi:peroxiredoxin